MGMRAAGGRSREKEGQKAVCSCLDTGLASWGPAGRTTDTAFQKLTAETAVRSTLLCLQVPPVCVAMPALFGPLKTHSLILAGFSLTTCSKRWGWDSPVTDWKSFSYGTRGLGKKKKIASVLCPCKFLIHFAELSAVWKTGEPSETNSASVGPLADASPQMLCGCFCRGQSPEQDGTSLKGPSEGATCG